MLTNYVLMYSYAVYIINLHIYAAGVAVKVTQSCLTLCDPMDCSLPASSVHGILQARILAWVPCPPPDLSHAGTELGSPALQADSLPFEPTEKPHIGHRVCDFKMAEEKMNMESY